MSFQAYLDNIETKTGKKPDDIATMVRAQGLSKPSAVVAWLKSEFGLGHGHSMAIVSLLKTADQPSRSADDKVAVYFSGAKAKWHATYDRLVEHTQGFGPDVTVSPGSTYLSLVKSGKKLAIVQATGERMDVGIKLKGVPATARLEDAGTWNTMVTRRVRIKTETELDEEIIGWLQQA